MYFDNKIAAIERYLIKLSGHDKESGESSDHNYVKPWSAHADSHRTKPAKMLFMDSVLRPKSLHTYPDEELDILNVSPSDISPFDNQKTKVIANELERILKFHLNADDNDGSELENIEIVNNPSRRRMFKEVMEVINNYIVAKKTFAGQHHEFIKRKLATERGARQLRNIFGNSFCDFDDFSWINKMILDKGDLETVSSYLSIIQNLSTKIPKIVDKILRSYSGRLSYDNLCQILKKKWDPTVPVLNQIKPKKLPGNPFLLLCCAGFNLDKVMEESPRFRFWTNGLNALCKTMLVPMNCDDNCTYEEALEGIAFALKSKITEFKNHFPNRPVILAGWTIGALIACHVALETPADAVVCFGFPLTGVNGSRGDLNDPLLESNVPTLFIIGQNSNMCSTDDIEDFRSRMRVETGLVIVGGADDLLRVSPQKLLMEAISQEIVDRCILDEVSEFLQTCFVKLPVATSLMTNNPIKNCPTIIEEIAECDTNEHEEVGKRKRKRPKEYSPECSTSRKRTKQSAPKEIPNASTKSRLSPSSSETSSSGSCKNEKQSLAKAAKKNPEKRGVGRPPNSTSRKKTPAKPPVKSVPVIPKQDIFKTFKPVSPAPVISSLPKRSPITALKSSLPFALNILPKKNDPVDVEKAFGKDSSFLPRPLTPPEPEDTISAEETEKAMAELEKSSLPPSGLSKLHNVNLSSPISQIIPSNDKNFIALSEQSSMSVLGSKTVTGSIIKPVLNSASDTKKGIPASTNTSGFKTVFQQGKVVAPVPSSVSHLKNIGAVNLTLNQNTPKAMITVPSHTRLFASGQHQNQIKTAPGKVLQILSKGVITLKTKDQLASNVVCTTNNNDSSEQQSCNVSLVSDVAGTEPLKDAQRKVDTGIPSATLVKLAVPEKMHGLKHIQVLKPMQVRSTPPTRIDTPEEVAEKQLAIQALNKSVGIEPTSPPKETGYSICYAKPDGSIISRIVPRPGPSTYIRQSIISQPSSRGKTRPILPSKSYQFYHK